MSQAENNKRIAKNTALLYVRMILITIVTLYTSRIVLEQLGVEDFGIYNLVGGMVSALSILTQSLSGACSRFINFEQGTGNKDKLKSIVSTSFNIQIILSIVVILLLESLGGWFLNTHLSIPPSRLIAANWVLQFTIATFAIRLIIVPLNALIISHERMNVYAYLSIIDVTMQLIIVFLLQKSPFDRLVFYGFMMMVVPIIVFISYLIYCKRNFEECCYTARFEKTIYKEMIGFAGWNFVGVTAGVLRNQGIDIIVNLFFGVVLNAARGIANQVSTAITRFASSFMTAINPQITKSFAAGDYARLQFLVHQGSRFSYYLFLFMSVPIILEMDFILQIWLKTVPEYASIFSRLMVVEAMVACLSNTMITAMLATGKIKRYQLTVGLLNLLNFPISYALLKFGVQPYITYVVMIILEFCCLYFRLYMMKVKIGISISAYIEGVLINIFVVTIIATLPPLSIFYILPESFLRLCVIIASSLLSSAISIYFVGLKKNERELILSKILKR